MNEQEKDYEIVNTQTQIYALESIRLELLGGRNGSRDKSLAVTELEYAIFRLQNHLDQTKEKETV